MAHYDIYTNSEGTGFLLDVQADLLDELNTRVVIPLLPLSGKLKLPARLNPVIEIDGKPHKMVTNLIATVPLSSLGPSRANMLQYHDDVSGALDMLFKGF